MIGNMSEPEQFDENSIEHNQPAGSISEWQQYNDCDGAQALNEAKYDEDCDDPNRKKLIVAGGRNYRPTLKDVERIRELNPTHIVSGGATGADALGERFAKEEELNRTRFLPDWNKHGKAAGPIRNRQMAEFADEVILFPGGRGTASMYNEAVKAGLVIHDYRDGT